MTKLNKKVLIVGCGWLGFPLAVSLKNLGHDVFCTTRNNADIDFFNLCGLSPVFFDSDTPISFSQFSNYFDAVYCFLPFKRSFVDPSIYFNQIKAVLFALNKTKVNQFFFSSSTSIYPLLNQTAYESDDLPLDTLRQQILHQTEQLILNDSNFKGIVFRFAGLYGPNREIGSFLKPSRKKLVATHPVNLIHLDDCIAICKTVLFSSILPGIYNLVSDAHPSKKELYEKVMELKGLSHEDIFSSADESFKVISNQRIKEAINYSFIYPNPKG